MLRLIRYCFFRLWARYGDWEGERGRYRALAILSLNLVFNVATSILAFDLLVRGTLATAATFTGMHGIVLFVLFFALYYVYLARRPRIEAISREFENPADVSAGLVVAFWIYDLGSPLLFFGSMLLLLWCQAGRA